MKDQKLGVEVKKSKGKNPDDSNPSPVKYSVNADHQPQIDADSQFDDKFPPGYRFKPFNSELIVFYLRKKILNETLPPNRIKEVDLYKFNPETLTEKSKPLGDNEWYFFTPRDRKYKNGKRPNRAAAEGYWRATGADKRVEYNNVLVGFKKSLVFYRGKSPKGHKTDWIMHEFRVDTPPRIRSSGSTDMRLDDWVICRIYKKKSVIGQQAKQADSNEDDQQSEEFQDDEALDTVTDPPVLPKETPMPHGLTPGTHDNALIYPQNTFNPYIS